ncbi:MAG: multicopper oxidase domain-containing protein [Gammaproteobacteria bacterium]|nr:multicopper oxidase domain-containing protein [Gammaproteobacteria bacterium]
MNKYKLSLISAALLCAPLAYTTAQAVNINVSRNVSSLNKTLSGQSVTFWTFSGALPAAAVEVGVYPEGTTTTDTLNLTLNLGMMTPGENAPYNGHTIHLHGADVPTSEDGVPETYNDVNGDTYTWTPTRDMAGSYMYHCHVHTVKHLEMGMYGPLIVRPKNAAGAWLNQLTHNTATAYDYVQNYVLSTVDPAYHTATGDSTVFADYNPAYFLITGNEGKTTAAPAMSLTAAKSKKVALRLIGIHSVSSTFAVKDGSGVAKSFTVYTQDGRALSTPQTLTSLDISPGQRFDIIFTTPSTAGTWYPQVTYKNLRNGAAYTSGTVYGKVTF